MVCGEWAIQSRPDSIWHVGILTRIGWKRCTAKKYKKGNNGWLDKQRFDVKIQFNATIGKPKFSFRRGAGVVSTLLKHVRTKTLSLPHRMFQETKATT